MSTLKIRSLEHIDGKPVRYSTITSQHPEIFVQRKANTGELIISTDTNNYYAMHHIYVGGEHIAGGYGFHTAKVAQDLTYIQETYTGVYNNISNSLNYLNNGYTYLRNHVSELNEDLNKKISANSFHNISVNQDNNTVRVNDSTTYVLDYRADTGILSIMEKPVEYIELYHWNNGMINIYDVDNPLNCETIDTQKFFKVEIITKRLNIENSQNINWHLNNYYFGNPFEEYNVYIDTNNQLPKIILNFNTGIVINNNTMSFSFNTLIPIIFGQSIPFFGSIYQATDVNISKTTNKLLFSFVKPLIYCNINEDEINNFIQVFNTDKKDTKSLNYSDKYKYTFVDYFNKQKNVKLQMELHDYLVICVPTNLLNVYYGEGNDYKTYDISFNVSQYDDRLPYLEGGFKYFGQVNNDYVIYISDKYNNINLPVCIDIEFYYNK